MKRTQSCLYRTASGSAPYGHTATLPERESVPESSPLDPFCPDLRRVPFPSKLTGVELLKPGVRTDFQNHSNRLLEWARSQGKAHLMSSTSPAPPSSIDSIVVQYLDLLFFDGANIGNGEKVVAALRFLLPHLGVGPLKTELPRCARSLRSWKKLAPGHMRLPIPFEAVLLMAREMWIAHESLACLALLIQFDTYLRPGELCEIKVLQLIHAPGRSIVPGMQWGINVRPSGIGLPASKTGGRNEALLLHARCDLVLPILRALFANLPLDAPLFDLTVALYNKTFQAAAKCAKTAHLEATPYAVRHGGASRDYFEQNRAIADIKLRGRWVTEESARRYQKSALYQKQRGLLTSLQLKQSKEVLPFLRHQFLLVANHIQNAAKILQRKGQPVTASSLLSKARELAHPQH
eukprot:CAMPEP_0206518086 /NCGR_PEP_ID=MMETSP0324_2-20121206/64378_1 /ASSEMBLY_ACC=CAM_ASM_000836 /TAXON_ID=2866 /ORGANISM="Crypthecodinium cohnii, Strain Seligo" /LENGTH=406 /DNA_ID=CAMNT_0054011393 /DNA_START=67 /DNA_END=1288 /DNA_ORIENTATION=-